MKSISIIKETYSVKNQVLTVALGILLMFASTHIQIPIKPVPINLQTAGALIIALCFKKKEAMKSIIYFVILGAAGLPIFSGFNSGIFRPTGGYLLGMILCVYLVTTMREYFGEKYLNLIIYGIIGLVSIYAFGISWLAYFIGFEKSLQLGLFPFIIPGILKTFFTISTVKILKRKMLNEE